MYYFRTTLFTAVPTVYRHLEESIDRVYADVGEQSVPKLPSFLRFGSWIGGDRDGNPHVTPDVTRLAVRLQARTAFIEYLKRVKQLIHILTHSDRWITPSPTFIESLNQDQPVDRKAFAHNPRLYRHEPYCRKLGIIRYRLRENLRLVHERLSGNAGD